MKKEKLYYQIRIDYFWLSILAVIIVISIIIAYYASAHEQTSSQPVSTKHRADIDVTFDDLRSSLENTSECYLCGNAEESLMSYFRNFDTIGLISLNDWYVIDFPLKNYDENGNEKTYRTANPNGNRFYFDFAGLQVLYYDYENKNKPTKEKFLEKQNLFSTVKNFKAEEKINQEKYIEKPANVAHEIASFFDIEQYLLGVIDRNNNYINENFTYKLLDLANRSGARDAQLERKVYFNEKMLNLNDNDEKEKVKIENDIKKIDKEIEEIDNAIWDLSSETERFKIKFQQENRLNDVILGISRWLKENQVIVETIKKIDTE